MRKSSDYYLQMRKKVKVFAQIRPDSAVGGDQQRERREAVQRAERAEDEAGATRRSPPGRRGRERRDREDVPRKRELLAREPRQLRRGDEDELGAEDLHGPPIVRTRTRAGIPRSRDPRRTVSSSVISSAGASRSQLMATSWYWDKDRTFRAARVDAHASAE